MHTPVSSLFVHCKNWDIEEIIHTSILENIFGSWTLEAHLPWSSFMALQSEVVVLDRLPTCTFVHLIFPSNRGFTCQM